MSLEFLINKIIKLDPYLGESLQPLSNRTIALSCSDFPDKIFYCTFCEQSVQISMQKPLSNIDAQICGPLHGLLMLAIKKDQADIRTSKIQFSGDLDVAQSLQELLFKLDIDWEEELSKYTGDIVAHTAVTICKQIKNYSKYAGTSLEAMITEYLQEESGLLPTAFEINRFINSVDELRLAVDRLEASINLKVHTYAGD